MKDLIQILADGNFHSGSGLGSRLGLTRAAVWKKIESLRELGLEVYSVRGKGYRLARPLELLSENEILAHVPAQARERVAALGVHWEMDSTSRYLMEHASRLPSGHFCLAERQTAGRGRRGRQWVSPFGANLYLSVLWRFDKGAAALSGLSLAIGVAVIRALEQVGASGATLKWPNDVLWEGRKLAGILVELKGESEGPCDVIAGVGINLNMPKQAEGAIDQPWADIAEFAEVGRNRLAGSLITSLVSCHEEFDHEGLSAFSDDWEGYHAHGGSSVRLELPGRTVEGNAIGIDHSGALLLEVGGEVRTFASGEVSLRPLTGRSK